ncbi:long-chain acyl-CoA synthetase [Thalassobacillus cyri]|uniref:Long-chain acyl-CoA synthetase n=1 Tax=Thalassobacillus cyri TaxID=571932 RepID=A0A1H4H0I2_9BACI|nr:long-chain fatty acid--CoA ligase [Thalassobacillus cyri]SEB14668.1 long-chain acyl-CoA synthetase [Thalassobacillus cyri]
MENLIEHPWYSAYPDGIERHLDFPECSLYQMLENSVEIFGEQTALIYQGEQISYQTMKDKVDRLANVWDELEIGKGDRIGLMVSNCPSYVYAFYAAQKLGAIVVQMNPMYTPREMEYITNTVDTRYLVTESKYLEKVAQVAETNPFKHVFVIDDEKRQNFDVQSIPSLIQSQQRKQLEPTVITPKEDIAVIQFTGGTTGKMKGAMLTHYNLVANVIQSYLMYGEEMKKGKEVTLTCTPLYHVYAMTSGMNLSIYLGASNILVPKFQVDRVLELIQTYRPTFFPGVPTMYNAFINHPDVESYGLNCLKFCSSGSAPLPIDVIHRFEKVTGATIGEGYGMSETSPSTHRNPTQGVRKIGSIGIPFPGTDSKVVDVEGSELPPGSVGELIIHGPQVMKGYWKNPEETAKSLKNGWIHTGDLATMDEDGYFYIVGRKKELIISGGFNVYPQEIEGVLYEHPEVKEAAAIGIPDDYSGERVKAYVVLNEGAKTTSGELTNFCQERLTRYKVPKEIEIRDSLPRNSVGKLLKRHLVKEEQYRNTEAR